MQEPGEGPEGTPQEAQEALRESAQSPAQPPGAVYRQSLSSRGSDTCHPAEGSGAGWPAALSPPGPCVLSCPLLPSSFPVNLGKKVPEVQWPALEEEKVTKSWESQSHWQQGPQSCPARPCGHVPSDRPPMCPGQAASPSSPGSQQSPPAQRCHLPASLSWDSCDRQPLMAGPA